MASGIYKITNLVNGKCYVGSSVNIKVRFYTHKSQLKHNKHDNRHLQAAYNKYGVNSFQYETLEECARDKQALEEREQYYMDTFQAYHENHGYNLAPRAYICIGVKHTAEAIAKRVAANTGHQWNVGKRRAKGRKISTMKTVQRISIDGLQKAEYNGTLEAAEAIGISPKRVQMSCRSGRATAGFYWQYKDEPSASLLPLARPGRTFHIEQRLPDGTLIALWENLKQASKGADVDIKGICASCNERVTHHKGFIWSYIKPISNA